VVDVDHGASWLKNIIGAVVEAQPEAKRELAPGAALSMVAFRRYNRYLAYLFGLIPKGPDHTAP